jgi:ferredoxin-NADP reductase
MTEADTLRQQWNGERRFVTADFLPEHLGNLSAPILYFAGPSKMVAGVSNAEEAGVDPTRVQSEEFDGY